MSGLYTCNNCGRNLIILFEENLVVSNQQSLPACINHLWYKVSEGQLFKQYTVYWSELERKISYPLFNKFQSSFVLANSEQFHAAFLIRCKSNNLSYKISDKFYPFVTCLKKEAKQKISQKWHKTVSRILYPLTLFADQPLRIRQLIVISNLWVSLLVFKN